jgi:hypothetical protein
VGQHFSLLDCSLLAKESEQCACAFPGSGGQPVRQPAPHPGS